MAAIKGLKNVIAEHISAHYFCAFCYCGRWIFITVNASFRVKLLSLLKHLFQ